MGIILNALKEAYKESGMEVQFLGTKPRVIQTAAQAKYSDTRKVERGYVQGVHKARKENKK